MVWFTGPATRPDNLPAYLKAHGFTGGDTPCMALDLMAMNDQVQAPPDLAIRQVGDGGELAQWCHTMVCGFPFPEFAEAPFLDLLTHAGFGEQMPLRLYIGWLEGQPVATSMLLLGAGVAGIYCIATIPEARRKGIGTAMTLAPLRDARELGYRLGVLGSSEMGFGVYHRIGFREVCRRGHNVWRSEKETAEADTAPTEGS